MTRNEQAKFVRKLVEAVNRELLQDIEKGKVPEDFEGMELRQLLADRFRRAVFGGILVGKRKKDYLNAVLVNDL